MKYFISAVVAAFMVTTAHAHEWTPTYPKFEPSFMDGIVVTKMKLFNKRKEVEYYAIDVYDEEWNPVPFAASEQLIEVGYLEQKQIDIYIREVDCDRIEYICTTSRLLVDNELSSGINSRICSKV
tara:strand:+ start:3971 stop:4345 length:375 start_codon:yes stop_codon:yes gene_type:complete